MPWGANRVAIALYHSAISISISITITITVAMRYTAQGAKLCGGKTTKSMLGNHTGALNRQTLNQELQSKENLGVNLSLMNE